MSNHFSLLFIYLFIKTNFYTSVGSLFSTWKKKKFKYHHASNTLCLEACLHMNCPWTWALLLPLSLMYTYTKREKTDHLPQPGRTLCKCSLIPFQCLRPVQFVAAVLVFSFGFERPLFSLSTWCSSLVLTADLAWSLAPASQAEPCAGAVHWVLSARW